MRITIVDYGMGNIKSIHSCFKYLGVSDIQVSSKYEDLKSADKLLLPGVGSFGKAITQIKAEGIDKILQEVVLQDKKPILGICLGMQLLGESSTEDGFNEGLGFVKGKCTKFEVSDLKVPHVGFNQVKVNPDLKLYQGLEGQADFYFTHSFKMTSEHEINQCHCNYGQDFVASFEHGNIAGTQFHPELSQTNGLNLLKNFIEKL